jgi:hypothetical protein
VSVTARIVVVMATVDAVFAMMISHFSLDEPLEGGIVAQTPGPSGQS